MKLEKVNCPNFKDLRDIFDKIKSNMRSLNTVRIDQEEDGSLLILIALEMLPNVIRLQISRKLGKGNWRMENLLKSINIETTAHQ